jgi:hypothetical protein
MISRQTEIGTYIGSIPTVFVPSGEYTFSAPVNLGHYVHIQGEKPIIKAAIEFPKERYAFEALSDSNQLAWRCKFEGLQFDAINGFDLHSDNLNGGEIIIRECNFFGGDEAIRLNCQSTRTLIDECIFDQCTSVLTINSGDRVSIEGGWIIQAKFSKDRQASITIADTAETLGLGKESPQVLTLRDIVGVPNMLIGDPKETAWINNYGGTVIAYNLRIGGEPGSKTFCNWFVRADSEYPVWPQGFILRDSECWSVDGYTESCILRLMAVPNFITFENNRGLSNSRAIAWANGVDPANLIQEAKGTDNRGACVISIDGNSAPESWPDFVPDEFAES